MVNPLYASPPTPSAAVGPPLPPSDPEPSTSSGNTQYDQGWLVRLLEHKGIGGSTCSSGMVLLLTVCLKILI